MRMLFWRPVGGVLNDIGSLGVGIAGMTGAFDAEAPSARNYAGELSSNVAGQAGVLPDVYGAESQWQPQFASLAGSTYGGLAQQLIGLLTGKIAPAERAATTADRQSAIGDLTNLGGSAAGGIDSIAPGAGDLLRVLTGNATQRVQNGMSPGELRDVQQAIRGGQAARGMGYGPSDQAAEVYGVGLTSRQLQQDAEQQALASIGASKSFYIDPILAMFSQRGPGQNAGGAALSLADILSGRMGPKLTNPESGYAGNLYAGNYAGQLNTNLENAKLMQGYAQMTAKGGDSIGKALGGMML